MLFCDFVAETEEGIALEFDEGLALFAVEVIMLWVAIVMFVDTASIEFKASQETGVDEFFEGTVDGGSGDVVGCAFGGKLFDELIGIEVFVVGEDAFDEELALFGVPEAAALEVFLEPFDG